MSTRHLWTLSIIGAGLAVASIGGASITGTKHDMSGASWNTSGTLCGVCHTAHNSVGGQPAQWNHQVTVATFTLYSSSSLNSTPGQPNGTSKLCLSCHDGTVALSNFGGVTTGTSYITGSARVGTDLSNDHPIGMDFTTATAAADGNLFDPSTKAWNGTGTPTISSKLLFNNKMECASCHNVHDNQYGGFLRKPYSQLCTTCHDM